jgi:predicted RNA methylase
VVTSAPVSLTNCPGTSASFNVSATGTGLSYQWYKGVTALAGQTGSSLAMANVSAADAGTYAVVVGGTCGSAISNSAVLTVNAITVATPLASVTNNLGTSVTFATVGSGTGLLTYAWKKNGTNIIGATTASLTLTNLGHAHAGVYTVEVAGTCNTTEQSATLTINIPPTVSIVNPTNGTVFIAPANFTVLADAQDVDGTVTNVQFFYGTTNFLGETFLPPYGIVLTNVPVGSYTFSAKATDNLGASGTSAPVSITVIASPPLGIVSAMSFNPQTDLFQQTVRVSNPTSSTYDAARVYVYGLTNNTTVYNASGSTNGIPYVESQTAIASGGYVDFVIEYWTPLRIMPNPTLRAELVSGSTGIIGGGGTINGTQQHINQAVKLPDKTFLLEFASASNRVYYVQYSSDLKAWKSAQTEITGNGTWIQWIDNGQPKTESTPATTPIRFYRVIMLP